MTDTPKTPRERPILMSGPLVREILADRKHQTRRPIKNPPAIVCPEDWDEHLRVQVGDGHSGWGAYFSDREYPEDGAEFRRCPYFGGGPGPERLWVRETHVQLPPDDPAGRPVVRYRADGEVPDCRVRWTPGIHMPRWACRLVLEVTEVRVERLHDISHEDAKAEGVSPENVFGAVTYRDAFALKWQDIYGTASWDANPWVWAITFRRITP